MIEASDTGETGYISTRGQAPRLGFEDAMLAGLARDGGLYVPETWPRLDPAALRGLRGLSYPELAARVMAPFVAPAFAGAAWERLVADAYAEFDHAAVVPLHQLDHRLWLLELFHGPTLAFKDVALQLLGRLFAAVLSRRGQRMTIVGATSGDTGSAAIEACRDREAIDVFILHPHGRTSAVQRRQMTTVLAANIHNIAIEGSFDDCQDLVKAMFNDTGFRDALQLSAINSINWARVMAQVVYYVSAAVALGAPEREIAVAVPTGNFGNVYAAYGARAMGVPISRLIVGSNPNDILTRFFASGTMSGAPVTPTLSPSMDIQVSSNFERLLFDLCDRDGARVARNMTEFREHRRFSVDESGMTRARALFSGYRIDDRETLAIIRTVYQRSGVIIDPHTAVGVAAAWAARDGRDTGGMPLDPAVPVVVAATAHPAKFPQAVAEATGVTPALPPRLADLDQRPERLTVLPAELGAVQAFVRARARITAGTAVG